MNMRCAPFLASVFLLCSSPAYAQAPVPAVPAVPAPVCTGGTCVAAPDMTVFLQALEEKQCLVKNAPVIKADPIIIVVDKSGRVFGSGSDPKPFTLNITWCNYQLQAAGETKMVVGQALPQTAGFRFRPKAAIGLLGTELIQRTFQESMDAGLLLEPVFFFTDFNLNAFVGFRSVGGGFGMDITKTFGAYLGYAITWGTWRSNPMAALYFSFW